MKHKFICLLALTMSILLLCGCQIRSTEFQDDYHGRIAKKFFPDTKSMTDAISPTFEYRKTTTYEGYYLKLVFENENDYEQFLAETETEYSTMTETQRQKSYFIIDNIIFKVGDYSFRAIDLHEYDAEGNEFVGLIANCKITKTIVFMYFWNEYAGIEDISIGLGQNGYMEFYKKTWYAP